MKKLFPKVWRTVLGLTVIACFSARAQNYTFTTIVGNAGYGSADGAGSAARFNGPTGLVFDSSGSLFVADGMNQTIRKLTLSGGNWVVTTIAGAAGFMGTANGTNGTARFNSPTGITTDSNGNVFVSDAANNTIRKLAPSGTNWVVTTIAGLAETPGSDDGTNSTARFNYPQGVVTDSSGNVLVADTYNYTIRKVTSFGIDWVTSTLAGAAGTNGTADGTNTAALFGAPFGIARDNAGNIYVADNGSHTIRKLTPSGPNWVSSTIAGLAETPGSANGSNSVARFNGPTGLATDSAGNIFVAEYGNNMIRKITPLVTPTSTNWSVTTIAGQANTSGSVDGTNNNARFFQPYGVAVDTNGNVFVADQANNVIRKISPSGNDWVTTTIAGRVGGGGKADGTNLFAQFADPHQGAVDAAGNVYVADTGNYSIRKLTKVGPDWVVTTIAGRSGFSGTSDGANTDARFFYPYGLTISRQTNLFVADTFNFAIRKITFDGTDWITTTIAGTKGASGTNDGSNTDARFSGPEGVAADTNGTVYVADTFGHTIRKVMPVGEDWIVTTIAGHAGVSGTNDGANGGALFKFPSGIAVDGSGNLIVTDSSSHTIRKLVPSGPDWIVTTIGGLGGASGSDDGTNQTARFSVPFNVAVTPDGSLIIADLGNNTVRKMTPSGPDWITTTIGGLAGIYGVADGTGEAARFSASSGVAVDSSGRIFLSTYSSIVLGELATTIAPAPSLQIKLSGNKAVLYWPQSASDFNLETTSPLQPGAIWTNLPGATVSGTNYWLTNTISGGSSFFRLRKP